MSTENTIVSTEEKVSKRDIYSVPSNLLRVKEGFNIRTDYGNIEELAKSIESEGVKNPLRGHREEEDGVEVYVVTDGHRRHMALMLLLERGVQMKVPFILEGKGYKDEQRVFDMFTSNSGKPLTPLEQAIGVSRLVNYGYKPAEIARKLGKSGGYIGNLLRLMEGPKALLNLVEEGVVAATLATQAIKEGTAEALIAKAEERKAELAAIKTDPENDLDTVFGTDIIGSEENGQEGASESATEASAPKRDTPKNGKPVKTTVTAADVAAKPSSMKELRKYLKSLKDEEAEFLENNSDKKLKKNAFRDDKFTKLQISFVDFLEKMANNELTDRRIKLFISSLSRFTEV